MHTFAANVSINRVKWLRRVMTFLVVMGPGLIVMEADNDAGALSTYTEAGATYGLHLLWLMLILLPVTYLCQEMVVRLGIVTGEGHAAIIYKRFGKWWYSRLHILMGTKWWHRCNSKWFSGKQLYLHNYRCKLLLYHKNICSYTTNCFISNNYTN